MLKYSRQREAIKTYLSSTKEHPTADVVYRNIRETIPNISLGTVYRNLSLLVENGEALKLTCGDGSEHFDGCVKPHYHFVCNRCRAVSDLEMPDLSLINELARKNFNGTIEGHYAYFYGICAKCNENMIDKG